MSVQLPVVSFPAYIEELSSEFESVFQQNRQMTQFKRLLTGFTVADKRTITHMNGLHIEHTNQSNLNRFLTQSNWEIDRVNQIRFGMINENESDGYVILDDFLVEKSGTEMHGVNYHFDHCTGRNVWGQQITDCVFSGRGIYPLLSTLYIRKDSRWLSGEFKSKIEIQKEHLDKLVELELDFSTVLMDTWYFNKDLTDHIESLGKDWVTQSKSNRLVKSHDKWISLNDFAKENILEKDFKVIKTGDNTYQAKALTVTMKKMGVIRLVISMNDRGKFNFFVSNRLDWNELAIISRYSRRWDIEVWHREGKGHFGLKDCQLRSGEAVSRYLTLSALAANLLEIATMLSPVYATLKTRACTPELKHRWILAEIVGQLISFASGIGDVKTKQIIESILCPYKSTMKIGYAS